MKNLIVALCIVAIPSVVIAGDDYYVKYIELDFPQIDTSTVVVGDKSGVSKINDSIWFFSEVFEAPNKFNRIVADFVCATKDTATATGLSRDSITIILETRNNQDSIKIWRVLGSTTRWPMSAWDSTGLATLAAIFNSTMTNPDSALKAYPSATNLYTGAAERKALLFGLMRVRPQQRGLFA